VLLLHGFTGSSAGWSAIVEGLKKRHRMVVPDLLGHGRSDAPHDSAPYALSRQAGVLASLLAELGAQPATVFGYSMGARLALSLAVASRGRQHSSSIHRLGAIHARARRRR
jgi:pimeloyl-ACP methyl ester carboxylesterase